MIERTKFMFFKNILIKTKKKKEIIEAKTKIY